MFSWVYGFLSLVKFVSLSISLAMSASRVVSRLFTDEHVKLELLLSDSDGLPPSSLPFLVWLRLRLPERAVEPDWGWARPAGLLSDVSDWSRVGDSWIAGNRFGGVPV